ncbi:unnamed protein product [Moneuplotes crassus]|uniref:Uncharacterized protein n=1 Tax=Euplotes crassus TaxID=5936 RepID=A0AAD1U6S7_EUPCR|nr:unnamed protein product [Moneuplotes crassus]
MEVKKTRQRKRTSILRSIISQPFNSDGEFVGLHEKILNANKNEAFRMIRKNKLVSKKKEYVDKLEKCKKEHCIEEELDIDKDATLMINNFTLLTQVESNSLDIIYIRFMIGDESKQLIFPPFADTSYIPISNITKDLYLVFLRKKGEEPSYLDNMIGNIELPLEEFLDQRKHRIKRSVQLTSDASQVLTHLDMCFDVRLCYSRVTFLKNLIQDIDELINRETLFENYDQEEDKDQESLQHFIAEKQKAFQGFLARKSLRDAQSKELYKQFNLKMGEESEESSSSDSNDSNTDSD